MKGPGKYDALCTDVREKTNAECAFILIFNGDKGSGFSCQIRGPATVDVAAVLEYMAGEIRKDASG